MNEQRNLILAIVLSMAVLVGWNYFFAPKPAAPGAQPAQSAQPAPGTQTQTQVVRTLPRAAALTQSPRAVIDTPTLDGSINLTGGRFDDLKLRAYRETIDPKSPEIELLSPMASEHPYFAEFGWIAPQGSTTPVPGPTTAWTLAAGDKLSPGHDVTLSYNDGQGLIFTRHIFVDARYMFTITDRVENRGASPMVLYPYALVSRHNLPNVPHSWIVHEGFIGVANGALKDASYADLAKNNDTQHFDSTGGWVGITDKFWMAAVVPPQGDFTGTYKAYDDNGIKAYQSDYLMKPRTVAPGGAQEVTHRLFAGAKVVDILKDYRDHTGVQHFDLAVDWGWFWFITQPMFVALDYLFRFVGNFGVAILIFTVFMKLLFFPLANTSYRAMSKMKKLQPEMERIRERFKDDRVQQQQATMELYKTERVNPLAGCLPMLIQIPVFFSLYKVLVVSIEMRHAPFFGWIRDLSAPDPTSLFNLFGLIPFTPPQFLMIGVLPLFFGMTMWVTTNLNPPAADPTQAKIFAFMPLLMTYMLSASPAGLVIYWTWSNLLSMAQQMFIMHRTGTPIDLIDRLRGMGQRFRRGEPLEKPAGPPD